MPSQTLGSHLELRLDALACFAGSAIGVAWDGPRALLLMQGLCGGASLPALVEMHLVWAPGSLLAMLIAMSACCRPAIDCAKFTRRPGYWLSFGAEVLVMYVAMMAIMMYAQLSLLGTLAPHAALLGGIVLGNLAFLGLAHMSRGFRAAVWPHRRAT